MIKASEAKPQQPPPPAFVWHAGLDDGLRVDTTDGNYGVQIGILVWTRFDTTFNDKSIKDQFTVPLVRPRLQAHFFRPWLTLFVQPEFAISPRLLDLEFDIHPIDEIGIKLGQFMVPFSHSFLAPVPKLQFQGFTAANETFRANRDTGVMLFGTFFDARLEYFAGVFNGNTIDLLTNDNPQLLYAGRLAGTVFGKPPPSRSFAKYDETLHLPGTHPATLMLGIDGYINQASTSGQPDQLRKTGSVDVTFIWQRLYVAAEGYLQGLDTLIPGMMPTTQTRWGADVQVGYMIVPERFEVAARYCYTRFDAAKADSWFSQVDGQLNGYVFGNHLKAGLRYTLTDTGAAQRGFDPGISHSVFLQVQSWI